MRIAVLGLGFMGSTHLKALKNIPGAELVAVSASEPERLAGDLSGIQGNLGGPGEKMDFSHIGRYLDPYEALADANVEAVDICLPTDLHAPVALAALRAGRHVLVEKPMALDAATADLMVAEARRAGKILMTAQVLRFFPEYQEATRLIKSGALGAPRAALLRRRCSAPGWSLWLADASKSGGGVFDLLIHDVDCALNLFGAPEAVTSSGYCAMERGVDIITSEFHYPDGVAVTITGGWHHPKSYPFSMEFTIVADGGTLDYSSAGRPLRLHAADGAERLLELPQHDGYQKEIEYFVACAAAGREPELCRPEESAAAVKVALAMVESRSQKGKTIACKL